MTASPAPLPDRRSPSLPVRLAWHEKREYWQRVYGLQAAVG